MVEDREVSQIIDQIHRVRKFENELGLPKRFFEDIKNEDDWSFVIKLHALIEASITNILKEKFAEQDLIDIFSLMELSNQKTGKIAFIKKMDLLPKKFRNFISKFSELRNLLVHNISNVSFNFNDYIQKINKDKLAVLSEALAAGVTKKDCGNESQYRLQQFTKDPKFCTWLSALCLISIITVRKELFVLDREQNKRNTDFMATITDFNNKEE